VHSSITETIFIQRDQTGRQNSHFRPGLRHPMSDI